MSFSDQKVIRFNNKTKNTRLQIFCAFQAFFWYFAAPERVKSAESRLVSETSKTFFQKQRLTMSTHQYNDNSKSKNLTLN